MSRAILVSIYMLEDYKNGVHFLDETVERVISELRLLDKELEALQQPKSCEGCKHYKFTYNSNDGAVRQLMTICSDCFRRLNRDNYEPKE